MTAPLVTETHIGRTVTFTSKNPTDPTTYTGVVTGVIAYAMAPVFGFDMVSYNAAVQRVDPTAGDIDALNYFVISLANNQPQPALRLFTSEWIAPASFSVIDQATIYRLDVYDIPAKGLPEIVTVLRAAGFNATLATIP